MNIEIFANRNREWVESLLIFTQRSQVLDCLELEVYSMGIFGCE